MKRKETYKNADYPNRKPAWQKHPIRYKEKLTQAERVLNKLDWEKLAKIGKRQGLI